MARTPPPETIDSMQPPAESPADLIVADAQAPPPSGALVDLRTQMLSCSAEKLPMALAEYSERRRIIHDWLRQQLKPGVHFGFPPGCEPKCRELDDGSKEYWVRTRDGGKWYSEKQWTPKPSFYKAGADFMVDLFALREEYEADMLAWEQLGKPQATYVFRCRLYSRGGDKLIGEGYGARKASGPSDINAAIKMAMKSAKIAAVLEAFSLSDLYTQDLEDLLPEPHAKPTPAANAPKVKPRGERTPPSAPGVGVDPDCLTALWDRWCVMRQQRGKTTSQTAKRDWVAKVFRQDIKFDVTEPREWDVESFRTCEEHLAEEENATG